MQAQLDPGKPLSSSISPSAAPPLRITRTFQVPVSQLFGAFKTATSIKEWWWPTGLYSDLVQLDFRKGGRYFINMKGIDQGGGGMTGHFESIEEDKLIAMTDQFANEKGEPISPQEAGMEGPWPDQIRIELQFSKVSESESELNLVQDGIPLSQQKDCVEGWNESFDKLVSYLGKPH